MAQDYLRPAALKAGILTEGDRRRFGFHNLRHSFASYLVTQTKTDIKTVQAMLRHADSETREAAFVERQLHEAFGDHRVSKNREFFRLAPERARAALYLAMVGSVLSEVQVNMQVVVK